MGRSFLRSSRVRKQSQFQSNGQRAGLHFRTLRVEPLEDRRLLALGDLLQTLNNPTPATSDYFGHSVAVSGATVVVGAYMDNMGATEAGAAHVFDAASGDLLWTLNNPTPVASDFFGYSAAAECPSPGGPVASF